MRSSNSLRGLRELVDGQRLADDRADRHARVQRRVRILEDDLHVARQRAQLVAAQRGDVLALEPHLARRSARSGAGCSGRWCSCRSPIRRPGRASRRRSIVEADAVDRVHAGRPRAEAARRVIGKCLTRLSTLSSGLRVMPARKSKMHATLCPGATSRSGGVAVRALHDGVACSAARSGSPRAARSAWARCRQSARAAPCASRPCRCAGSSGSGPACTDGAGARTARPTVASSTTLPAYITTTRCAISATTPIACVISMIAMPSRAFSSASRSRICAWIVTSSAVVGSSAISSLGLQDSAIAIITRWRMPPENWCG